MCPKSLLVAGLRHANGNHQASSSAKIICLPRGTDSPMPEQYFSNADVRDFPGVFAVKRIVAIPARHADQIRRLNVFRVLKIFLQRPLRFVEVRIRKLTQPHDASWLTWDIRNTFARTLVDPQPVFIRSGGLDATRFGDHSKIAKASTVAARNHVLTQVVW